MKNKLIKLMEKEGFILFLFVCVCVIAGGTLFLSMRNINANQNIKDSDLVILDESDKAKEDEVEDYDENPYMANLSNLGVDNKEISNKKVPKTETETNITKPEDTKEEVLEASVGEDNYAEVKGKVDELEFEDDEYEEKDANLVEEAKTIFLPIEGAIITDYTSDSLIYSETLEAWVGHGGIDIEASEGTIVKAAADGVVKEVYEDELWGIVILIDHGGDLQTRYSGLGTKEMIKVGSNVKKGDHISKVGNTAKIEMLMKPHLHFEVIKNGKLVDPRSIND